ncbi:CrcB-like protein [Desulfotomaculum nigrificans CO-1-SRB]|uniref:Fluoride-specific ion channel FluC n=1 Tax=Desulfotomaculum nigrificans (strain DSM 14880 / VKM B-2319 / CO-1-SRB) TaxID=868595 RepID=F6B6F1_DESCC|nr:fluoride efflux transporter CrcB [Desulfotomaculum nigrificans]AEF93222.1 CrcB-like protein [Desulfotomaculum nigrificans CO-1-SRB]
MDILAVGIGGIFGALCRYGIGNLAHNLSVSIFPYGTLTVNLIGSFLLSFVAYGSLLRWNLPRHYLLAVNTGFVGSFTTFSTFSVETMNLILQEQYLTALSYQIISLVAGFLLSWAGIRLATVLFENP